MLLTVNMPIGLGSVVAGGMLFAVTRNRMWLLLAAALYLCSWLLLGLGLVLAGRSGYVYAKEFWHKRRKIPIPHRHHDTSPPGTSAAERRDEKV